MSGAGASHRRLEYMPVTDLPDDDRNPKLHAEADLDASIDRWGYTEPVLLDERTGRLISGHGRKAALLRAQDAGQHPPDGIAVNDVGEWLVPVVRGWASRSDNEAAAYLAAANQLTMAGGWDDQGLLDLLDTASGNDLGLTGTGFNDGDMDVLRRLCEAEAVIAGSAQSPGAAGDVSDPAPAVDPYAEWRNAGMPDYETENQLPVRKVLVSFATEDHYREFKRRLDLTSESRSTWFPEQPRIPRAHEHLVDTSDGSDG